MPNWCYNRVSVSGEPEDVTKFFEKHLSDTTSRFFNSVIPMPEELRNTVSPRPRTKEQIYKDAEEFGWTEGDREWHLNHNCLSPEEEVRLDKLKELYGADNWYDWGLQNWACKWDVDVSHIDININDRDGFLEFTFDTAWGPPEGVHAALVAMYPDLHFSWFYDEPGMEFAGYLHAGDVRLGG